MAIRGINKNSAVMRSNPDPGDAGDSSSSNASQSGDSYSDSGRSFDLLSGGGRHIDEIKAGSHGHGVSGGGQNGSATVFPASTNDDQTDGLVDTNPADMSPDIVAM